LNHHGHPGASKSSGCDRTGCCRIRIIVIIIIINAIHDAIAICVVDTVVVTGVVGIGIVLAHEAG
jgi:hypothetical protein